MQKFNIRPLRDEDKDLVRRILTARWDSPLITSRGKIVDGSALPGFLAASAEGNIIGLITLQVEENQCEVVSIDSLLPQSGVGSALLNAAREYAVAKNCRRLWLVTSNDNLAALRFYQRRGMRLVKVYPGAIDYARAKLKPQIPDIGEHGIPVRDEIELELLLPSLSTAF